MVKPLTCAEDSVLTWVAVSAAISAVPMAEICTELSPEIAAEVRAVTLIAPRAEIAAVLRTATCIDESALT